MLRLRLILTFLYTWELIQSMKMEIVAAVTLLDNFTKYLWDNQINIIIPNMKVLHFSSFRILLLANI